MDCPICGGKGALRSVEHSKELLRCRDCGRTFKKERVSGGYTILIEAYIVPFKRDKSPLLQR